MSAGSNSKVMTVEERLVQKFKGDALATLVEDEDAITELARRAVHEALFKDREVEGTGWQKRTIPSPSVEAAKRIAEIACQRIIDAEVKKLTDDPKFIGFVRDALAAAFPLVLQSSVNMMISRVVEGAAIQSVQRVQEMIKSGLITVPVGTP